MNTLQGIRVLDLTQAYSGPFCTMHLADQGADVIKIELPGVGDQSRTWAPFENGYSAYYSYINRNKRGITLNLKTERGKEIFKALVAKADVVCENFRVGTMEKLGLGYDVLKEINPRLIYGSISGFGLNGPLASRPSYDIVAQAMSGMMSVTGFPEHDCVKVGPSIGDNYSGTYLALGICMALYQRERTGLGQRLDVAMLDTLFSVMENFVIQYTVAGVIPQRQGNIDPGIAPFDVFKAKDGAFAMGCGTNRFWESLCTIMNRPDLVHDERYDNNEHRCENYLPELRDDINAWARQHTLDELEEMIVAQGIPFGRILDVKQVAEHEQIRERNMLWSIFDAGAGKELTFPGTPIKMHGQTDAPVKAAPTLGEDTDLVLQELLGFHPDEIQKLQQDSII